MAGDRLASTGSSVASVQRRERRRGAGARRRLLPPPPGPAQQRHLERCRRSSLERGRLGLAPHRPVQSGHRSEPPAPPGSVDAASSGHSFN